MENNYTNFDSNLIKKININVLGKKTDSYDILTMANFLSTFESANYYSEKMNKSLNFESDFALLEHALNLRKVNGQILE